MNDMQTMLETLDKKLDAIMEHLGCSYQEDGQVSSGDYQNMTSDQKDSADANEVLGNKK